MSDLIKKDADFVWHPFTQHETERAPIGIVRAKNASLFAEDGKEILDLISSWWTCLHGHSHPALNEALSEQAEKMAHIMFSGFTHEPAVDLASELAGLLPEDLSRVFYSDNGSTSVEVALKLVYQYWLNQGEGARKVFVAFEGGYHGDTLGAMSVGKGCGFFSLFEDLMCEVETVPFAETWDGDAHVEEREAEALEIIDGLIEARGHELAGIILEPLMQGAGGMRFCRPSFLDAVCERIRDAGGLIVFDEVATGFGRTGSLFAFMQTEFVPDVICLSKGLTAGYMPMSVTVARESLFDAFLGADFSKALPHGHSFTANPLACAVALRSLRLIEEEKTLDKIAHIQERHKSMLPRLHGLEGIACPRVLGTVLACNLSANEGGYKSDTSLALRDWYLAHGLNIRPIGPVIYLMPPYCITDGELESAYEGLIEGIETVVQA